MAAQHNFLRVPKEAQEENMSWPPQMQVNVPTGDVYIIAVQKRGTQHVQNMVS